MSWARDACADKDRHRNSGRDATTRAAAVTPPAMIAARRANIGSVGRESEVSFDGRPLLDGQHIAFPLGGVDMLMTCYFLLPSRIIDLPHRDTSRLASPLPARALTEKFCPGARPTCTLRAVFSRPPFARGRPVVRCSLALSRSFDRGLCAMWCAKARWSSPLRDVARRRLFGGGLCGYAVWHDGARVVVNPARRGAP